MAQYIWPPSSGGSSANASVGPTGTTAPTSATEIAGVDSGSGFLVPVKVSSTGVVSVDGSGSTQPVSGTVTANQGTAGASPWLIALPTGASTSALQTTGNATLVTINTTLGSPFQAGGSIGNTSFIATQATGTNLHTVVDNFPATQPVSGTVAVSNFPATQAISAASLPLPTGAATSANQSTEIASLATIATNTGKVPTNSNGSVAQANLTATTASLVTAPANAVGFILFASNGNTANTDPIRFAIGSTASTTVGVFMDVARDSGYIPCGANISVCATASGTNGYTIQWVLSS